MRKELEALLPGYLIAKVQAGDLGFPNQTHPHVTLWSKCPEAGAHGSRSAEQNCSMSGCQGQRFHAASKPQAQWYEHQFRVLFVIESGYCSLLLGFRTVAALGLFDSIS